MSQEVQAGKSGGMAPERSVSFLKAPDADETPLGNMMGFLVLILIAEGCDSALFPNVTKALERTVQFDVGVLGGLATVELFVKASMGPFWGVMCARGYMDRRTILAACSFLQGLATLIMCFFINNGTMMLIMRALNGASLSGLKPIGFSIIADRFDDTVRGRYFAVLNASAGLGGTIFGAFYSITSEWCTSNPQRYEQCPLPAEGCGAETPECTCGGILGWKMSFIITGVAVMTLAPIIYCFMKVPKVNIKQAASSDNASENRVIAEIKGLAGLFKTPTFAILVIQGCFGSIPWTAFQFRGFFFETAGLTKEEVTWVLTVIGFVGIFGGFFSGWLGDFLNNRWHMHGRVLNAEFSVYGGIPFAFFTFNSAFTPGRESAFVYYATLSILLHLICGGVQGGTNAPILSALAEPEERALVIAWQTSLESAIASFGPIIFTTLNTAFGYQKECEDSCDRPSTCGPPQQNVDAAGSSLLFASCVPWAICGLLYSTLHYFLPRDMERIFEKRRQEADGAVLTAELVS